MPARSTRHPAADRKRAILTAAAPVFARLGQTLRSPGQSRIDSPDMVPTGVSGISLSRDYSETDVVGNSRTARKCRNSACRRYAPALLSSQRNMP